MQQRQLRLGDILDDYCPRERRVTNHAVVAMVGDTVKQTRCTTCDADHEYKHAKVPRQRRKSDAPAALYAQVAAGAPGTPGTPGTLKRVTHESSSGNGLQPAGGDLELGSDDAGGHSDGEPKPIVNPNEPADAAIEDPDAEGGPGIDEIEDGNKDEGPIHRRLIRASLPRPEGQQPPARPIPEFTIRQPNTGRPNRFRPRHRGGQGGQQGQHGHQFHGGGNRSNGNMGNSMRGPRPNAGRPGGPGGMKRHGPGGGRKRSK
jgi:hypothetical protein